MTSRPFLRAAVYAVAGFLLLMVLGYLLRGGTYYMYVVNLIMINAIAAIGLMVVSGIAGQMSLGTAGLAAIGAYGAGLLMGNLGLDLGLAILLASLGAMAIGTLLAAPALRLVGLHLAIVTLAFSTIVVQFIGHADGITGGMAGMGVATTTLLGIEISTEWNKFILIASIFVLVAYVTHNFITLRPGRAMLSMRDREAVAQSLGINVGAYKALAFAYSSFLAGLSGALYAMLQGYISVDDFTILHSLYYFVMIVIGGWTTIMGAILGSIVVTALPELLRGFADFAHAIFGVVLMLMIIFLPGGFVSLIRRSLTAMRHRDEERKEEERA